ncbi:hypothetical protein CesoFtcFv8_023221 [Champsocephalus esox]|uniref:Uncharacterized protein n=2 Tax=Channichthyidae TaxID=30806 RepID=A0AAN8B7S2_9TELE|nr:hypothetical protein KUCAC02_019428 [Chaenocephalus aceratus]KAK5880166.1 hypothetical protein CesoFtcFv8_023221 [Champsocephalus esox]
MCIEHADSIKTLLRDLRPLHRPRCEAFTPPEACRRLKFAHGRCSASRPRWLPHSHIASVTFDRRGI